MFLVPAAGLNMTVGATEVMLIKKTEAMEFISKRESEIALKKSDRSNTLSQAEIAYKSAMEKEQVSKQERNEATTAFATNAAYVGMSNAVDLAQSRYEDFNARYKTWQQSIMHAYNRGPYANTMAQQSAMTTQSTGINMRSTLEQLHKNFQLLSRQLSSLIASNQSYYAQLQWPTSQDVFESRAVVNRIEHETEEYPSANDYLNDFNPVKVDSSITSSQGNFDLKLKSGTMVFAKIIQGKETIYWLVDVPAQGHKLILSNQNIFNVSEAASLASQ